MIAVAPLQPAIDESTVQHFGKADKESPHRRMWTEMRSKLFVDLEGSPVAGLPLLEGLPQLHTLLTLNDKQGTVAVCDNANIASFVELEVMTAWNVAQPISAQLEFFRARAQCRDHGADIKVCHHH
jgi:hypothetical protein